MSEALFLKGIQFDVENELKRVCPHKTGDLRLSIDVKLINGELIVFMHDYGLFVEYGTTPHIITPKNKKSLHWKNGNKDVFSKIVHHPGTKPQPFIRNTLYHKLPRIVQKNADKHLQGATVEVTYT